MLNKPDQRVFRKQFILILLSVGIALCILGAITLHISMIQVRKEKYKDLKAITSLKVNQTERWLEERISEGLFLQNNVNFRDLFIALSRNPNDAALIAHTEQWVKPILQNHDYFGLHLYDSDNKFITTFQGYLDTELAVKHLPDDPTFTFRDVISLSQMMVDPATGQFYLYIRVPVFHGDDYSGMIIMLINPELFLFPSIAQWPVSSKSAESLLITVENESINYISPLRFANDQMIEQTMRLSSGVLQQKILSSDTEGEFFSGIDYRGKRVLAVSMPVSNTPWHLVSKIDRAEVFFPTRKTSAILVFIGFLLLTALGAILSAFNKRSEMIILKREIERLDEKQALEEHYGYLTKYANDIIMLIDETGQVIQINEKGLETYGYTEAEIRGMHIMKLRSASAKPDLTESLKELARVGQIRLESRHVTKTGNEFPVEVSARQLKINNKIYIQSIIRDITERKRYEESLRESQRTLSTLISNLQGIAYRCQNDQNFTMLYLSQGFHEITGFDPAEYSGIGAQSYTSLIHPDDRPRIWGDVQKANEAKKPFEFEYQLRTKMGDYRWVWEKGSGVYGTEGELLFLEGYITDITWRKRNELIQEILFNITNAVNIADNLPDLSSLIEQEISKIIDTANFLIALREEDVKTPSLSVVYEKKDTHQQIPVETSLIAYIISNNEPLLINDLEILQMAEEGLIEIHQAVPKCWLGVPLRYQNKVIGALVIQHYSNADVIGLNDLETLKFLSNQIALSIEKKKSENELRVAKMKAVESDRLKTAFLANMSHEIRTPMNAIIGFSDLLGDPNITDQEKTYYLNIIQSNGNVLLNLIDDIIDMAKLEAGQINIYRRTTNVHDILEELLSYYAEFRLNVNKEHVDLRFRQKNETTIEIVTDPLRFRQIMSNLINNALKFTESGYVEFGYLFTPPLKAPAKLPEPAIIFYVKDTGVGIPEDKIDLVFNRFIQAYNPNARIFGGTGLGLAISRNLAELLGGTIWLESKIETGTIFYLALPLSIPSMKTTESSQHGSTREESAFDGTGLNILIVEDEPSNALFLRKIIEKTGAEVIHAANGKEALEFIEKSQKIDCVFMDILMPGMDGYETTKKVKSIHPKIPVIAQTAYAMNEEIERCKEAGCDDHITKPILKADIISVLERNLPKPDQSNQ